MATTAESTALARCGRWRGPSSKMSDPSQVRIRVQPSTRDPDALRFLLESPVQAGAGSVSFEGLAEGAPLAGALFAVAGVRRIAVDDACIHVRKDANA